MCRAPKLPRNLLSLVLAIASSSAGCGGQDEAPALSVEVRTDYVPGVEFTLVRVEAGPADGSESPRAAESAPGSLDPLDWLEGQSIADITGLTPGPTRITVSLLTDDTTIVGRQPVIFLYGGANERQTLIVSRDCAGVVCPDDPDAPTMAACFSGMCADEACSSANPFACPGPACTSDGECGAEAPPCTEGRCIAGRCFVTPDDTRCGAGVCDVVTGCSGGDGGV